MEWNSIAYRPDADKADAFHQYGVFLRDTRQQRRAVPGTDPEFSASPQTIILRRSAESGTGQHFPSDQVFGHYDILREHVTDRLYEQHVG